MKQSFKKSAVVARSVSMPRRLPDSEQAKDEPKSLRVEPTEKRSRSISKTRSPVRSKRNVGKAAVVVGAGKTKLTP